MWSTISFSSTSSSSSTSSTSSSSANACEAVALVAARCSEVIDTLAGLRPISIFCFVLSLSLSLATFSIVFFFFFVFFLKKRWRRRLGRSATRLRNIPHGRPNRPDCINSNSVNLLTGSSLFRRFTPHAALQQQQQQQQLFWFFFFGSFRVHSLKSLHSPKRLLGFFTEFRGCFFFLNRIKTEISETVSRPSLRPFFVSFFFEIFFLFAVFIHCVPVSFFLFFLERVDP